MKKGVLLLVFSLFIIGLFLNVINISTVGADSGFDSSYDSGGSDWGSGTDWDSESSGGSSDPADLLAIPYIFWGIIGLALSINKLTDKKVKKLKSIGFTIIYILSMILILIIENLLSEDFIQLIILENIFYMPFFVIIVSALFDTKKPKQKTVEGIDSDKLINTAFVNYKELQIAWMNFDYDKIKELVNDEMYNMYINQLETLKIKNQQNIMSDIEFIEGYITDYKKVNNKVIFKIYLSVSCYDYIINTKNNMTVRGNKNRKLTLSYILTFEKNIDVVKYCPQCGAEINNLTECEYCKSKIVNNTSKIKMIKKEIKSQK